MSSPHAKLPAGRKCPCPLGLAARPVTMLPPAAAWLLGCEWLRSTVLGAGAGRAGLLFGLLPGFPFPCPSPGPTQSSLCRWPGPPLETSPTRCRCTSSGEKQTHSRGQRDTHSLDICITPKGRLGSDRLVVLCVLLLPGCMAYSLCSAPE